MRYWLPGLLLAIFVAPAGCNTSSGADRDDSKETSEKKTKKKKKQKKGDEAAGEKTSLTEQEISAACKREIDKKLDDTSSEADCRADYAKAWSEPNRWDDLDDVKVAVGRHACAMDASSSASFGSCMGKVYAGAKLVDGQELALRTPVYPKRLGSCRAWVERPGFKTQLLLGYQSTCTVDGKDHLRLEASGVTALWLGDRPISFGGDNSSLSVPLDDLRAGVVFTDVDRNHDSPFAVPLKVTNGDGEWSGFLFLGQELLASQLLSSPQKGLLLPGEDPGGPVLSTHLILGSSSYRSQYQVVGTGKTLRDVGKIALIEDTRRVLDTCHYRDGSGKTHSVTLTAVDAKVTIIERKSGRRLASTLVKAPGSLSCRGSVSKDDMHKNTTLHLPNKGVEIATWAKAELAK